MDLILFTNTFPYPKSEQFLVNEFEFTKVNFDQIYVYTLIGGSQKTSIEIDPHVHINNAVFKNHKSKLELILKGIFNLSSLKYHLKDFFENSIYKHPKKIRQFFTSVLITRAALSTRAYAGILNKIRASNERTTLYFYWGNNLCWMLPYLKEKVKEANIKIIIRFHRTDLYEYTNNDYAPLRKFIFEEADQLIAISEDGYRYLNAKYPGYSAKIHLSRLGVFNHGLNPYHYSGKYTIVSTSFVTSVKRVNLILEALKKCKHTITWHHFGDGPLFERLKELAVDLPENITVDLKGFVKNSELIEFYKKTSVDLFMNVSSSEGLPVSIMEALSFGIPVIATDAGGTSEIVDADTGKLIPVNITTDELSTEIETFLTQLKDNYQQFRENARKKFELKLEAQSNYTDFYRELKN